MFQTPEGQSSRRTGTPNAPVPLARLENGSRFLEALPEREANPDFNPASPQPATRGDEDYSSVFVDLDKSLPPSPSSNSPRRRTVWPQAPSSEAAPLVPAIPYHILQDTSPSPKVFPQDPNIRAGEVHLGTGLVPIAQAQAYREAQKAEYLRTHPDVDVEVARPSSRPGLKRLASALRDGAKGLSRAGSKRTVAQQPASPAPAAPAPTQAPPAAPRPIRRKMVGHEDRNTRFSDFLNLEPSPESSPSESQDELSPREEVQPTPPPPPIPPRSQHRIPRKPIAARRHAPTPAPINPRLCPCPECTQERSGRRTPEQDQATDRRQQRREGSFDPVNYGEDGLLDQYSPLRHGPFDDERTPIASHQPPSSVYDHFSPSSGSYHNPAFSASANDEVNRLLDLDWREKRETTIVDTRAHDSHTSFLVTKFKDGSEVESHHYRQPLSPEMVLERSGLGGREVSEDEDGAMAVWRRMEAETGGVVSPGSRSFSTVRQAQIAEQGEHVRTVGDFARGLRDADSSSENAEEDE